jgi:uncharacterized protein YbjT (DUF2867 family)
MTATTPKNKTALLFGATGMVGGFVLNELLHSEIYSKVIAFTRRPLSISHSKLENPIIDFEKLPAYSHLIKGDDLFLCLGTTMKKAGSKDAFKKVDFDYPYQVAKMAEINHIQQVLLCSAVDANAHSMIFYNQVKGHLEDELKKMNFESLQIFQPSLLLGERNEVRSAESFSIKVSKALDGIIGNFMGKYRPIEAEKVAVAMVKNAIIAQKGTIIHASDEMKKY